MASSSQETPRASSLAEDATRFESLPRHSRNNVRTAGCVIATTMGAIRTAGWFVAGADLRVTMRALRQLCTFLDKEHFDAMDWVLPDMYQIVPDMPLNAVEYKRGAALTVSRT